MTIRNRLSAVLAAYLPFLRFRKAELPHLVTVRGLIPTSREAWARDVLSFRIFEITERTRSQVSLNLSGFARYWASVRGEAGFGLDRGLLMAFLIFDDGLLPDLFVAADDVLWDGFALDDPSRCTPLVRGETPDGCFALRKVFMERTVQDLAVLYKRPR
jgi:hypothetical protein